MISLIVYNLIVCSLAFCVLLVLSLCLFAYALFLTQILNKLQYAVSFKKLYYQSLVIFS